jgi:hypothetical protein
VEITEKYEGGKAKKTAGEAKLQRQNQILYCFIAAIQIPDLGGSVD